MSKEKYNELIEKLHEKFSPQDPNSKLSYGLYQLRLKDVGFSLQFDRSADGDGLIVHIDFDDSLSDFRTCVLGLLNSNSTEGNPKPASHNEHTLLRVRVPLSQTVFHDLLEMMTAVVNSVDIWVRQRGWKHMSAYSEKHRYVH